MTFKLLTTYIFTLLLLSSCGQTINNKQGMTDKVRLPTNDTSNYAILQFDKTNNWIFKNSKPTTLTESEIQRIDTLLKQSIDNYNSEKESLLCRHRVTRRELCVWRTINAFSWEANA
jgi:hypothetical protein